MTIDQENQTTQEIPAAGKEAQEVPTIPFQLVLTHAEHQALGSTPVLTTTNQIIEDIDGIIGKAANGDGEASRKLRTTIGEYYGIYSREEIAKQRTLWSQQRRKEVYPFLKGKIQKDLKDKGIFPYLHPDEHGLGVGLYKYDEDGKPVDIEDETTLNTLDIYRKEHKNYEVELGPIQGKLRYFELKVKPENVQPAPIAA